ncbi:ATP-binding protein [Streptacidiphilus jiangxiensis]|uniref:Regulatory protein, luxR family n=1 Tax=Streptacidiphilus jiangxiensis TaxID=235985 RepID=A0A1H7UMR1_STRJI|nr:LuxR family transcriptional regulator [Streptacidiphilus jiangxiensis]SEL98069.1 regulatory protein, luxR family [Streptacidiphilus jiangxiensis]
MARVLDQGAAAGGGGFAFVGRERELGLLLAAVRTPPAVVLVEGEAGIGKSRLVHEAVTRLTAEGRPVLTGFCHPLREPFPYGPVVDALRRAGPWLPADGVAPTAGALAPLLPDLADRLPPPPPRPEGAQTRRHQLVQAVHSFLAALGPSVLLVEDLHWADEATRELLLLLARDLPDQLAVVLTYRAEDLAPDTPVLGAAYRWPPGTNGTVIRLRPLSRHDVGELASAALGSFASTELGAVLYERSQGLPLVAEEDLLTLREHGPQLALGDARAELERAGVPRGLREAVTERLAALSASGAAVVDAAAVLAVPAPEPLLTRLAGLDPDEGADGLVEALQVAVLGETPGGCYVFRHTLAQQVAYWHVPGPHRARLHLRAVEELEREIPVPLVQIAHHTLASGDRAGWFRRAEQAVDQAIALGDTGTAAGLLHQILEQLSLEQLSVDQLGPAHDSTEPIGTERIGTERIGTEPIGTSTPGAAHPPPDGDLRSRAALALARIAVNGADHTRNAAVLRRILADPQLATATRGEIRLALGLLMVNHAGDRGGYHELEHCVDELIEERPERAARAMVALAMDERNGAASHGPAWLQRAEQTVARAGDRATGAAVRATRLTLLARDGSTDVWGQLDALPRESPDLEVLRQTTRALYNVGELAVDLGHDQRGADLLHESRELAHRASIPHLECYSRIALLRLEALAGHWDGLEERFAALGAEFPEIAMFGEEQALVFGLLATARGRRAHALEQFTAAATSGARGSQVTVELRALAGQAELRLLQRAPRDAWALAAPAVDLLRESAAWARATGLVPVAVEAALGCGEDQAAARLVADVERELAHRDAPGARAELACARGLLALAGERGRPGRAAEEFERGRHAWQAVGRPYDAARAAERCAGALGADRPEDATAQVAAALDTYDALGATADAARCRQTLRDLGVQRPAGRGRRGYGGALSPRERQVAELLATGATNQDIAEALFLSPRTVEQHVASVLKKLGTTRKAVGDVLTATDG